MIDILYNKMAIPESCFLGKRVFKKLFHENTKLSGTDKKAFRDDIDVINWQYTLKPTTIPIQAYEDSECEYNEITVLQVDLKTLNRTKRIAEIIHRAIPYPLIIVFVHERSCAFSLAHKRYSMAEKGAIVAENIDLTGWIDLAAPTTVEQEFLDSLYLPELPHTHFLALYSAFSDRTIALECARLTGNYQLESKAVKQQKRRNQLTLCHDLEAQIATYKAAIKKESQFNRKVELNMKIKELKTQLKSLTATM